MNNQGWIKIYRQIFNTSFYGKPLIVALFLHCILKANHQQTLLTVSQNGKFSFKKINDNQQTLSTSIQNDKNEANKKETYQQTKIIPKGIVIARGSFVTSLESLSKETGISIQSIRTALVTLKSTHTLTIKSTTKFSVITILNYNQYQGLTNKLTNKQQTTNKQLTTNNNVLRMYKNVKEKVKTFTKKEDLILDEKTQTYKLKPYG